MWWVVGGGRMEDRIRSFLVWCVVCRQQNEKGDQRNLKPKESSKIDHRTSAARFEDTKSQKDEE